MTAFTIEPNERITCTVHYEDDDLLVIGKAPGIVTQPGLGHERNSLLNGLFARYGPRLQKLGKARDFGLLHRLDKDTSGLLVVALRAAAYDALRVGFESRLIRKYYWAVVKGKPRQDQGVIRKSIAEGRAGKNAPKLARVSSSGKPAITAYRVLDTAVAASLVECRLLTGRLHQIRIHMEAIACPVLGDDQYAPDSVAGAAPRLALHAHRVAFLHPTTGATIDIRTDWPSDLRTLLRKLSLRRPDKPPPEGCMLQGGHEVGGDAVGDEESGIGKSPAA